MKTIAPLTSSDAPSAAGWPRRCTVAGGGRWGARQVHYRHVGTGPVVLCLHQSPLSSRDMLGTMERWKTRFTCIAPDTAGFGLSTPLGVATADVDDPPGYSLRVGCLRQRAELPPQPRNTARRSHSKTSTPRCTAGRAAISSNQPLRCG